MFEWLAVGGVAVIFAFYFVKWLLRLCINFIFFGDFE